MDLTVTRHERRSMPRPRRGGRSGNRPGDYLALGLLTMFVVAVMGFWIYDERRGPWLALPIIVAVLAIVTFLRAEGHIEWHGSRRARSNRTAREAKLDRMRGIADVDPDLYNAIVAGRVIMNPYILDDDDRLAAFVRELRVSRGVADRRQTDDASNSSQPPNEPK